MSDAARLPAERDEVVNSRDATNSKFSRDHIGCEIGYSREGLGMIPQTVSHQMFISERAMDTYVDYKMLLDLPTPNPELGFDRYAGILEQIILTNNPQFAIGIFGRWGSGKSTLMDKVSSKLDDQRAIKVAFSAWRYEKEEHLIVPMLDSVREALVRWVDDQEQQNAGLPQRIRERVIATASVIGKVTKALLSGFSFKVGLPETVELSFKANEAIAKAEEYGRMDRDHLDEHADIPRSFYHAAFRALRGAFENLISVGKQTPHMPDRIVVFIDDLDRCLPSKALDVLESMKLFFDFPGFVFVVGLDQHVVESFIDTKFRRDGESKHSTDGDDQRNGWEPITGASYIQKIFQIPFNLPPLAEEDIDDLIKSIIAEAELDEVGTQATDLRDVVRPHLTATIPQAEGRDVGLNPRQVKRFINSYVLQMKILEGDRHAREHDLKPDADVVLTLQTIQFRPDWSDLWLLLNSRRDLFLDALSLVVNNMDLDALRKFGVNEGDIPNSAIEYLREAGKPLIDLATNVQGDQRKLEHYLVSGVVTSDSMSRELSHIIFQIGELALQIDDLPVNDEGRVQKADVDGLYSRIHSALDEAVSKAGSTLAIQAARQSVISEISRLEQSNLIDYPVDELARLRVLITSFRDELKRQASRRLRDVVAS